MAVAVSGNLQKSSCAGPSAPFVVVRGARDALVSLAGTRWSTFLATPLASDAAGQRLMTAKACGRATTTTGPGLETLTWRCTFGTSRAYRLAGVGHRWPVGGALDATDVVRSVVKNSSTRPIAPR